MSVIDKKELKDLVKKMVGIYLLLAVVGTFLYANQITKEDYGIGIKEYFLYSLPYSKEEKQWLAAAQSTILYGADESSPPLRYVDDKNQQYKGVVIDYLTSLSIQLGKEIEFIPYPWETAQEKLKKKETDLADMFISDARKKDFIFSTPIYKLKGAVAYRSNLSDIDQKSDLEGRTVALAKGDYAATYLKKLGKGTKIIYCENVLAALHKVAEGKADVVVGDEPVINYYLKENNSLANLKLSSWAIYENNVALGTAKGNQKLLTVVNKANLALQKKHEVEKIRTKWTGMATPVEIKEGLSRSSFRFFIVVEFLGLMLLLIIAFNRILKKEILQKTEKLRQNTRDLEDIFESVPEMLMIVDEDFEVLNSNMVSQTIADESHLPKNRLSELVRTAEYGAAFDSFKEVLKDGLSRKEEIRVGNHLYEVSCYPMKRNFEVEKKLIISLKDITFQRYDEQQLSQINKMAELGQVASGIAHEIKNPLGLIRSYVYLLRETFKSQPTSDVATYLDGIENSAEQAKNTIDNLLDYSRMTNDEDSAFNLLQLINNLILLEERKIKAKMVTIEIDCDPELIVVNKLESMKHVLSNLISNAVDASETNGKITIVCRDREEELLIKIKDNGIGIAEDKLSMIFTPFYTTKLNEEGTGLGLYIVFNEIERMNGRISVESRQGEGTEFQIELYKKEKGQ